MANFFFILITAGIVIFAPFLALVSQARPEVGELALVISAPWGNGAAWIAAQSGVPEVSPLRAPLGVLVTLTTAQSIDTLYANGAWLILDGRKISDLC